jgi:hypothetical protein
LEARYRTVLRILPASYREQWEEEMVAAFLESMATDDPEQADYLADYGRPSYSEVASVAGLAVRLRLGASGAPARYAAWGAAVRSAALAGLLTQAVIETTGAGERLWLDGTWQLAGLLWLPPFFAILLGHRQLARALALLAVLPTAVATVQATAVAATRGMHPAAVTLWCSLLVDLLLVLALAAFHENSPAVQARRWLVAFGAGVGALAALLLLTHRAADLIPLADWPGVACAALTLATLGHLARQARARRPGPAWPLTLAMLTVVVFATRLVTLLSYLAFDSGQRRLVLTADTVEAGVVLALGIAVALLAARQLRRIPPLHRVGEGRGRC